MGVYKKVEYEEFIKEIEEGSIAHWQEIAQALGVDEDTITKWKKSPEAIAAQKKGISNALAGMTRAGTKDWRMYAEKLKMLGINPPQKVVATINDPRKDILNKYGLGEQGAGKTEEAESRPSADSA